MICNSGPQFLEELRKHLEGADYFLLAKKVGLHPTTIRSISNGRTKWPRETTLFCIVHALGLQIKLERNPKNER